MIAVIVRPPTTNKKLPIESMKASTLSQSGFVSSNDKAKLRTQALATSQ
jgi:hypothetical protein